MLSFCSSFLLGFMMNIIIWNCRGARKPSFRKRVGDLVQNYNPAILVAMETHVGGDRAREITNLLPFDRAFHTDTIGYAGGLWVLWNANRVDLALLSSTCNMLDIGFAGPRFT